MLLLDIWGWPFDGPGCLQTAVEHDEQRTVSVSAFGSMSGLLHEVPMGMHGIRSIGTNSIKSLGRFLMGRTTLNHDVEWLKPVDGAVSVDAVGFENGRSKREAGHR